METVYTKEITKYEALLSFIRIMNQRTYPYFTILYAFNRYYKGKFIERLNEDKTIITCCCSDLENLSDLSQETIIKTLTHLDKKSSRIIRFRKLKNNIITFNILSASQLTNKVMSFLMDKRLSYKPNKNDIVIFK